MEEKYFLQMIDNYNFDEIEEIILVKSKIHYGGPNIFEKIIVRSSNCMVFTPIDETDEILLEIKDDFIIEDTEDIVRYNKYNGLKIGDVKKCLNHLGYFDQYSIAIAGFNTTFSIICELSLLGIYESKPVYWL